MIWQTLPEIILSDPLALEIRTALPDALRVLVKEYPRDAWAGDPGFDGLVQFWLDRHMMFRRLMDHLQQSTQALLDQNKDPAAFTKEVARYVGMFVNQLHGHHQIEDQHYFPVLAKKDARVARGFDILDADHHSLDGHLNRFVETANGVIQGLHSAPDPRDLAGKFHTSLLGLGGLLGRHLEDEEDLVVPIILRHGSTGLG
jgi:iron-sulfur cluster repair protein YtfE (RIC family)